MRYCPSLRPLFFSRLSTNSAVGYSLPDVVRLSVHVSVRFLGGASDSFYSNVFTPQTVFQNGRRSHILESIGYQSGVEPADHVTLSANHHSLFFSQSFKRYIRKLKFQPLEFVSRYRDPQFQAAETYSYFY